MTQLLLAVFGLASAYMAVATLSPRARKWAPVVGLCGQPAWGSFAYSLPLDLGWPLYITVAAFTAVYVRGIWVQWFPRKPSEAVQKFDAICAGFDPYGDVARAIASEIKRINERKG